MKKTIAKLEETLKHVTRTKDRKIAELKKDNEILLKLAMRQNAKLSELSEKTRKLLEKAKIIK